MTECFSCSKDKTNTVQTWFYTEEKLVKKPLCRKCVDNEEVDFYGPKDMYTADEVHRRITAILHDMMAENNNYDFKRHAKISKQIVKVFEPTLEEEELNVYE
jgi:hypothetical protein